MSMDIDIKVDAPGGAAVISGVQAGLAGLEAAGPRAGAAISTGLREGSTAADKAKASAQSLAEQMSKLANTGGAFAGLTAQLQREAEVLESIKGPAREYEADLKALDGLLMKNTISTQQYADAVTKLNAKMGEKPAAPPPAPKETEGIGSDLAGSIGSKVGVVGGALELGAAVEAVHALAEISDKYTELSNSAQKFATSGRTVNDILDEQRQLSRDLHTDMQPTIEAYDRIRDATEQVNLTHAEEIRLTKTLGETSALNNKAMEGAAQSLLNLKVAFETGQDPARQLRGIMKEYPALAEQMAKGLGVPQSRLLSLVETGKVGFTDLTQSMIKNTDETDEKFGKRTETWGQGWKEFKDEVERPIDFEKLLAPFGNVDDAVKRLVDDTTKLRAQLEFKQDTAGFQDVANNVSKTVTAMLAVSNQPGFKDITETKAKLGDASVALTNLNAAHAAGVVVGKAYREQWEALMTTLNNGELPATIKMLDGINDPLKTYRDDIAALNTLLKNGTITAVEYTAALAKVSTPAGFLDTDRLAKSVNQRQGNTSQLNIDDSGIGDAASIEIPKADPRAEEAMHLYESLLTPVQKYEAELEKLKALQDVMNDSSYTLALADLQKKYTEFHTPLEQQAVDLKKIEDAQKTGLNSTAALDDAMRKWRMQYDVGTFGDGVVDGLQKIKKSTGDTASIVSSAMTGAFGAVNSSIETMVTTGKTDLSSLGTALEKIGVDSSLKFLESSAFHAGDSTASGTAAGVSTGTSASATMLAAAPAIGTAIGAAAAAAMAVGGGAAGLSGIASDGTVIGDTAVGVGSSGGLSDLADSDLEIPGAATGFSGYVGGAGGTDSKLAMFRVTPNEHVQISTPDQMASRSGSQGGGGSPRIQITNNHDTRGELLATLAGGDADTHVVNVLKRNTGAVQALLRK